MCVRALDFIKMPTLYTYDIVWWYFSRFPFIFKANLCFSISRMFRAYFHSLRKMYDSVGAHSSVSATVYCLICEIAAVCAHRAYT